MHPSVSASFRAIPERDRLNFSWLVRLRWAQIAGQTATVLAVDVALGIDVPTAPLVALVAVGLVSNVAAAAWTRTAPAIAEWHLAAVMALDVALLTALLYFTGGPFNPFSFLYLVQIALAAVILHAMWTWALVALSLGSFGVLLFAHRELHPYAELAVARALPTSLHAEGMWVALGVASAFIVHFLLRVTGALAARERELSEATDRAARQRRLASLATMAAGAAHELATPLGTIALVAKELERELIKVGDDAMVEDARLIREQVGRCRVILDQMAGGAGEYPGESVEDVRVSDILAEAMAGIRPAPKVRLAVPDALAARAVRLPPRAVAQALRSLITNAQDASPADREVVVRARARGGELVVEVIDRGCGMDAGALSRAVEPFFTTKEPGRGMGLGLFLTRAVVEGLGGALDIESQAGAGTAVTVALPLAIGRGAGRGVAPGRPMRAASTPPAGVKVLAPMADQSNRVSAASKDEF